MGWYLRCEKDKLDKIGLDRKCGSWSMLIDQEGLCFKVLVAKYMGINEDGKIV
jgi:hypothetical protein